MSPGQDDDLGHLNMDVLLSPSIESSLATAGVGLHWIASDPARLAAFAEAVSHCPGDIPVEVCLAHLSAVHDVLDPACPHPVSASVKDMR